MFDKFQNIGNSFLVFLLIDYNVITLLPFVIIFNEHSHLLLASRKRGRNDDN